MKQQENKNKNKKHNTTYIKLLQRSKVEGLPFYVQFLNPTFESTFFVTRFHHVISPFHHPFIFIQ